MLPIIKHKLLAADVQSAYDWHKSKQPGLGDDFLEDFVNAYRRVCKAPDLYSIRFSDVRRVNLERFPYGIFYSVTQNELIVLAILHASRDVKSILTGRRRFFKRVP